MASTPVRGKRLTKEAMSLLKEEVDKLTVKSDQEGVWVKPSIVFEVTYQEVQESPDETSGYALRVPKLVRIRDDKVVSEVDTLDKVRRLFTQQYETRYPVKDL